MPIVMVENRSGLTPEIKARLASDITDVVREVIKSPMDLISVVFHDLTPDSSYRSGVSTTETLIIAHIRAGRSDEAIERLLKGISQSWSRITGDSEDHIELAAAEYPAKRTMRGGVRLPEPPIV
ncbi:tautomerase family protein [Streptomyces sp. NPDC052036]|uniref:tautomerase family protein n=1 Tax=unclassified Streptomyces TaxID=2593676 RepID=UPI003447772A